MHSPADFSQSFANRCALMGTALLRCLPAETAHDLGMRALAGRGLDLLPKPALPSLSVDMGVSIPGIGDLRHPLGLAAGFDKNVKAPHGFARLGLAYLELGTITPLPQVGNPKPRMFRYPDQKAIVNRMGFNSHGSEVVAQRLAKLDWDHATTPLGINLGKNKATPADRAIEDYVHLLQTFADYADYFVINVSSPNTAGLRDLASPQFLGLLAERCQRHLPKIWLKLDPDLDKKPFQELIEALTTLGFQGVVLTNTHKVSWPEAGGQSGHPIAVMSSQRLEWAYEVHRGKLLMMGSGGVLSGQDVLQKMIRGASAVQLYAALIYRGPWAVWSILQELERELVERGIGSVKEVIGSFYEGGL